MRRFRPSFQYANEHRIDSPFASGLPSRNPYSQNIPVGRVCKSKDFKRCSTAGRDALGLWIEEMSIRLVGAAFKAPCKSSIEKLVLVALANHKNAVTGQCNPSINTLARECQMSQSGVRKAIYSLRKSGLVEYKAGIGRTSSRYNLRVSQYDTQSVTIEHSACHNVTPNRNRTGIKSEKSKESAFRKAVSHYPSEEEFYQFIYANELHQLLNKRPDLYDQLVGDEWHYWKPEEKRWQKIHDWRKAIAALNTKIEHATDQA